MRGGVESDPYPLMLFVVVVYSFSHSLRSDHSRKQKKKNLETPFFSSGFHHTKFDYSPLLCVLFLSFLPHYVLHSHTLAVQKILHPFSLTQTSKESTRFSLSPSLVFAHHLCWFVELCWCEFFRCMCACFRSRAKKKRTFDQSRRSRKIFSHFSQGKNTFYKNEEKKSSLFPPNRLTMTVAKTLTRNVTFLSWERAVKKFPHRDEVTASLPLIFPPLFCRNFLEKFFTRKVTQIFSLFTSRNVTARHDTERNLHRDRDESFLK